MNRLPLLIQACVTVLAAVGMPAVLTHPTPSPPTTRPALKSGWSVEQKHGLARGNLSSVDQGLSERDQDAEGPLQESSNTHRIGFLFGFFPPIPLPFPPPPPPKPVRPPPPRLPHKPAPSKPPVRPTNHLNEGHLDSHEFSFDFKLPDFFEFSGLPRPEEEHSDGPPHLNPPHDEFHSPHSPIHHHEGPGPQNEVPNHPPPHEMFPHSSPPHSHHEEARPPPPHHIHNPSSNSHPPPSRPHHGPPPPSRPHHGPPPPSRPHHGPPPPSRPHHGPPPPSRPHHGPPPPSRPHHGPPPPSRPHRRPIPNSIYRYMVPVKDASNPRDHIHDDLDPGGYKGLGNDDLQFIKDKTKDYISSTSSSSSSSSSSSFSSSSSSSSSSTSLSL